MTLTTSFRALRSRRRHFSDGTPDGKSRTHDAIHRCEELRQRMATDVSVAASSLRDPVVSKWARRQGVTITVSSEWELTAAIGAGMRPAQMSVCGDLLTREGLRRVSPLGVGRFVVTTTEQIEVLAARKSGRPRSVLLHMYDARVPGAAGCRFDSAAADEATAAILETGVLNLVGLHCDVGGHDCDFVSYPAALGHMIAEMTHIRRSHGVLLTVLSLDGGLKVPAAAWDEAVAEIAVQIDVALDDACAAQRFPRPNLVVSVPDALMGGASR